MLDFKLILFVGLGGFLGAILRTILINLTNKFIYQNINFSILIVNVFGCFLLGILLSYLQDKESSQFIKYFINIGLLGAFTTFSAFSYDNLLLLQNKFYIKLIINIILNVSICILAIYIGEKFLNNFKNLF